MIEAVSLAGARLRHRGQLALLGGPPLFESLLQTGRPNVLDPDAVVSLVRGVMARNWLTNDGPLVRELEACFADFQKVRHAVAVSNATTGLQLVARALGITGEVVMPAFTFVGTAHAMAWIGLKPVFCDADPATHTIDATRVAGAVTPDTGAIVGVHLWGQPCAIEELQRVADAHAVPLLFDAAHATGSACRSVPIGRFGRAEVFSLHATKAINGLEGGVITTDDDALADRLRLLRNFGFAGEDRVTSLGINAKMSEFSAAMALANLAQYPRLRAHNRAIHEAYRAGLADIPGLALHEARPEDEVNDHYAVVEVSADASLSRDALCRVLAAENVLARRYFRPGCHRSAPYHAEPPRHALPVTERLSAALIQLPTGLQLTPDDAVGITRVIATSCQQAAAVEIALTREAAPS